MNENTRCINKKTYFHCLKIAINAQICKRLRREFKQRFTKTNKNYLYFPFIPLIVSAHFLFHTFRCKLSRYCIALNIGILKELNYLYIDKSFVDRRIQCSILHVCNVPSFVVANSKKHL